LARPGKAGLGEAWQGRARQGKARFISNHGWARQGKARQDMDDQNILYIIADEQGRYKIGITDRRAVDRLRAGQTWNADRLRVLHEFKLSSALNTAVESWLHNQYHQYRTSGGSEWRKLSASQLERLVKHVSEIENGDCDIHGNKSTLVRQVHGIERSETRANRQSVLARRDCGHATDQPVLGSFSREHKVSREDVLRKESQAYWDGNQ
jgi:hypothetical protein